MTAIELKASLLNSIKEIDDVNLIERISRYVRKAIGENKKNKITKADLVIDPRALDIIKNLKGGPFINIGRRNTNDQGLSGY